MSLAQRIAAQIGSGRLGCEIGSDADRIGVLDPAPIRIDCKKYRGGTPVRADFFGRADQLPFHDHALQYLVAIHVLEHTSDPTAALAEWYRVVRPGGLVCLIAAAAWHPPETLRSLLMVQQKPQARLVWDIAELAEDSHDALAILHVRKGWLARAQAEVFSLRAAGHPRAALREDAQSFAEWSANTRDAAGSR